MLDLLMLMALYIRYQKPACYGRVTMKQPFILASRLNAAGNQVLIVDSIERSLKTYIVFTFVYLLWIAEPLFLG